VIFTIKAHGRTRKDTRALVAHLEKTQAGQVVEVVRIAGSAASDMAGAFADFGRIRDGSRATVAFHHLTVNPGQALTIAQRDEAVARIRKALGCEDHGYVLIAHRNKPRACGPARVEHFHLVIAHVGPDLRALRLSFSYAELEAARASLEIDFCEPLTPTRRSAAIAVRLRRDGRDAVAEQVEAAARIQGDLPRSGLTSRIRARLDRLGIAAPLARARVRAAYALDRAGFEAALAQAGLSCTPGDRVADAWVVWKDDILVGALDRLVAHPRAMASARMRDLAATMCETVDPEFVPGVDVHRDTSRKNEPIPAAVVQIVDRVVDVEIPQGSRSDVPSPLARWRAQFSQDLIQAEAALKHARRRSSIPEDRHREEREAKAKLRLARAERESASTLVQAVEKRQGSPGFLARLFGRKKRPNPELVAAETALTQAYKREARAETALETLKARIASDAAAYALRMRVEDNEADSHERHAEARIAFFQDALAVLKWEPWRAAMGIDAIREGVGQLRHVDRPPVEGHPHDDPALVDSLLARQETAPSAF
jgi:hypothetical protein